MTQYSFRFALFSSERSYALTQDGLLVGPSGSQNLVAYRDISRVWFFQVASQHDGVMECCKLQGAGKTILLRSHHRRGFVAVEDRRPAYEAFIHALIPLIVRANPEVALVAGATVWSKAGWLLTIALALMVVLMGVVLLIDDDWSGLWAIVSAVAVIPFAWAMANKQTLHRVDPSIYRSGA